MGDMHVVISSIIGPIVTECEKTRFAVIVALTALPNTTEGYAGISGMMDDLIDADGSGSHVVLDKIDVMLIVAEDIGDQSIPLNHLTEY